MSGQMKSGLRLHRKSCGFVTGLICLTSEKLTCTLKRLIKEKAL